MVLSWKEKYHVELVGPHLMSYFSNMLPNDEFLSGIYLFTDSSLGLPFTCGTINWFSDFTSQSVSCIFYPVTMSLPCLDH